MHRASETHTRTQGLSTHIYMNAHTLRATPSIANRLLDRREYKSCQVDLYIFTTHSLISHPSIPTHNFFCSSDLKHP